MRKIDRSGVRPLPQDPEMQLRLMNKLDEIVDWINKQDISQTENRKEQCSLSRVGLASASLALVERQ